MGRGSTTWGEVALRGEGVALRGGEVGLCGGEVALRGEG